MPSMPARPRPAPPLNWASCSDTTTFGGLIAILNLLNESTTPPAVMSMSYGECEAFQRGRLQCSV